jgi:hypothetical protein
MYMLNSILSQFMVAGLLCLTVIFSVIGRMPYANTRIATVTLQSTKHKSIRLHPMRSLLIPRYEKQIMSGVKESARVFYKLLEGV